MALHHQRPGATQYYLALTSLRAFDFSGNQELKYLPGDGPEWLFYHYPLCLSLQNYRISGGRRGKQHIFLSLMKKEIILTGHREEENSFLPVVTIKSSQPFSHWYCNINQATLGLRGFINRQHLASRRIHGSLPGFCYHKETDPRPSCKDGD